MKLQADSDCEHSSVVSVSVPLLICVAFYHQDLRWSKTNILSSRSERFKTSLIINTTSCFILPPKLCDEGFWIKLGFLQLFFALDSRKAASSSHSANAVFATVAQTLIPQGNTSRGEICKGCLFAPYRNDSLNQT